MTLRLHRQQLGQLDAGLFETVSVGELARGLLEAELKKVPTGGRRAVCVWPEGGATGAIPDVVGKFCYSIIRWSPDRLRDVLAGEGDNVFEGANGEALPDPNQDHLECE